MNTLLEVVLFISLTYISGCVYLFRGGSQQLPTIHFMRPALFAGIFLSPAIIAPYLVYQGIATYQVIYYSLAVAQGYSIGVILGWHNWWTIGQSTTHFYDPYPVIDWILLKIWGKQYIPTDHADYGQVAKYPKYFTTGNIRPVWWRSTREATGFFMRMCMYAGLFLFPNLRLAYSGDMGLGDALTLAACFTASFAFISVIFYAIFAWCSWIPKGDDKLNWAEFPTGLALGAAVLLNSILAF